VLTVTLLTPSNHTPAQPGQCPPNGPETEPEVEYVTKTAWAGATRTPRVRRTIAVDSQSLFIKSLP
jgi:hypothetical protein